MLEDFFAFMMAIIGICIAIALAIGVPATGITYYVSKSQCTQYHNLTGNEVYFSLSTGCLTKQDGQWIDVEVATHNTSNVAVKVK